MSLLFEGKRGVVFGVASENSIAWQISKALFESGAEIGFACQSAAQIERCQSILDKSGRGSSRIWECDVERDESIKELFDEVDKQWGKIDFILHAVAFTDRTELQRPYIETTRLNFEKTLSISAYSFTRIAYESRRVLNEGASLLTLTYIGSTKVIHGYNLMGIAKAALESSVRYLAFDLGGMGVRVNSMSAGPVKTIAGRGVSNSRFIYKWQGKHSALRRNISSADLGGAALYLLSDLSGGVTGENHYVDAGYNMVGMVVPSTSGVS